MSRTRRVAIMIDLNWPVPHHYDVYRGVLAYARERQWQCVLDPHALEHADVGRRQAYDGAIARVTRPAMEHATRKGVPLVDVWFNGPGRDMPRVFPDLRKAGVLCAEHLLARGFSAFGFLGLSRDRAIKLTLEAFQQRLEYDGRDVSVLNVPLRFSVGAERWADFQASMRRWIETWSPPIGICTGIDLLARHLADACAAAGLRVPYDVAIIGAGNEPTIGLQPDPALTTIDFGYERVGRTAAELLDRMMEGQAVAPGPCYVDSPSLIVRQSTDAFAVKDESVGAALRFISEHSHHRLRVPDVAAAVATTRRTLERRFRRHLGRSVAEEIERFRFERVKRQLAESDLLLKEIAAAAGFSDARQMYKMFLKREGVSPSAYRRARQAAAG